MSGADDPLPALLRRGRGRLAEAWASAERARRPGAAERDDGAELSRVLDAIATRLEGGGEAEGGADEALGTRRLLSGAPLAALVDEYATLRRVVTRAVTEAALEVGADGLERLHAAIDASLGRAAAAHAAGADAARDRIVGVVSHDLRNPLNAVLLGAQALAQLPARPEPERRLLARVTNAASRALRMIGDLLDYSKASSGGGIPVRPRRGDLVAVVEQAVDEMRQAFPERAVRLDAPSGPVEGDWDEDRLAQVVGNLVRNALQYSVESTAVTARVLADGAAAAIEVHNEGEPIDPGLLPHLFEPFRRGGGHGPAGSVGLGLYIAHEIVRAHGGAIEVRSTEREGTTVRVRLPR
ncbi:MAG TPA: HAMP domain-containing sensor histidine kinase [Polyangiaceae bacterium]|nr:HAMP domain-containing sensor histidine kinase [Polyangiaceae bacterium]